MDAVRRSLKKFRGLCFRERLCYECLTILDLENNTLTVRLGSEVRGVLTKIRGEPSLNTLKMLSALKGVQNIVINLRKIESLRKYQISNERTDLKEYFKVGIEGNLAFVEITYENGRKIRILMSDSDAVKLEKLVNMFRVED